MHPLALLLVTAPFGAAVLAPLAIALEREQVVHYLLEPRWSGLGGASTAVLVMLGGVAAFAMMLFEFRVVQLASGLTLSIAGVFKEVLTILSSVILLGERLTLFNAAGLAVCIAGIGGYRRLRLAESRAARAPPPGPYPIPNPNPNAHPNPDANPNPSPDTNPNPNPGLHL